MVERLVDFVAKQTEKPYPQTNAALLSLQRAMANELPMAKRSKTKRTTRAAVPTPARPRKRVYTDFDRVAKKQYDKRRRVEKKNEVLQAELAKHTAFKLGPHNYITPHWLVRVFLSQPAMSARGGATSMRDIAGIDAPVISRRSIERIRDAWVTKFKPMIRKIVVDRVKNLVAGATQDRRLVGSVCFICIWLIHIQDEADLKLRSREDDGHDVLRRNRLPRSSKTSSE